MCFNLIDPPTGADDIGKFIQFFIPEAILATFPSSDDVYNIKWFIIDKEDTGAIGTAKDEGGGSIGRNKVDTEMQLPPHVYGGIAAPVAYPSLATCYNYANMLENSHFVYLAYQALEDGKWNVYLRQLRLSEFLSENSAGTTKMPISNLGVSQVVYRVVCVNDNCEALGDDQLIARSVTLQAFLPDGREVYNDGYDSSTNWEHACEGLPASDFPKHKVYIKLLHSIIGNGCPDYNTGFDAMFVNWRVGDEFTVPPIAMSAPSLFAALQKGDATVSLGDFSTPVVINGISIKSSHVQVTWYDSPSVATWSTVVDPSYSDIQRIKGIDIGEPILLTGDKQTHSTRPVVKANYNNEVFVVYQNGDSGEFQVYLTGTAVPASELPMGITNPRTFDESLNYFYSTSDFVYSTQITSERSNSMPDMYIDLGNTIHLTWQSNRDGNWEVYYADSTHGFSNTRITEHNSKSVMPRLHGDGNGRVYITWSDDRFGAWDIMLAYILDTRVESLLEQDPYLAGTYNGYTHSYDQADLPLMNVSSSTVCITELEVHFYADRYRQLPIFTMTQSDYPYAFTVQSAGDELSTKTWETFELWTSNGTELTSDVVDTGLFQSELLRFNVNFSLPSLSSPIQVQEGLWVEEITGSIPAGSKIAAITNAAYSKAGEQSMQHEFFYAYVYSNILYVKRYSFGSVDTWSKDLSLTLYEVTDLKFDTTNVFNNYLHIAVKVDDAGDTQTVICTLSPAGVITDVVTMGSDIDAIIAFNEGANGYAAGLYLEDRLRSYGTNLLILDSAYELFDYAWDFVPPGRQDMDVAAIDFDPTGQYYNRLVMADYDLDADDVSAIYYLKPKAGEDWQSTDFETIFFQTPAVRRYVAMGFSNSALFGSSLYVADAAANAIYAVNTSGDHAPFATGFTSLSAMSFAYDSSILYVIDNGTVYRISATPMLQIGFLAGDQYSGGQITDGTWVSAYSIPFSQSGRDITPYDVGIPGRIAGQYKQVRLFWSSWTDLSWLHSVSITSGIAGRLCIPPESSAIATLSLLPTVRIDDAGNVEETELPADLIPNRAYFVSMFGRDPTNQLISLGDPQITISASTTERHETDLGRYTCSIPITVTNTTYTAKYYNFKVNFYSDKEKLYLLQSYNTFPSGRLDRFTIDDGQPATTRWTAKGLRVAPNATLTLALWPVVSNAGLTCDVEYFVDIESCNSDEGTTIPACQSRDLIVWQSLRWVCRCESARASAAFGTRPRYLPDLARWQSSAFGMADTRITEIIGTENIQPNIRIRSNWEGVILYSSNRAVPSSPFYELYASVFKTIPGHGMYANAAQNIVSPEGTVFVKKDIPVCADKGCVDENGKYVDGQILRGTYPSLDIDQFDHMFLSTEQRYDSLDQHLDVTLCEFLEKDKSQVVRIHRCGANPEYLVWGETQESGATGPSGPAGCQPSELINTFSTVSEELKKLVLSARIKNQFVKYHVTRHRIPMAVVGRSKVIIEVLGQPGAIGVRLRNNNKEEWSDWFPFEPKTDDYITEIPWILGPGNGYNNVYLQVISVQGTSQIFVLQFIADYDKVQYSINLYQLPAAGATGPAGPTGPRMLPSYNGLPLASMGAPLFDGSNLTYPAMQQFRVEIVPSVDYMRMFSTDEKNSGEANPTFDFLHQGDLDYLEQPTEYRTTLATGESQECFWGTITVKKEEKPEFKDGLATIIPKFKRDYSETPSTTTGGLAGAGAGNLGPPSDTYVRDEWNVFGSPITDTSCEGATWPDGGTVITDQEVWEDVFGQIRHRIVIRPTEDPFLIFGDPNYRFGGENDPV
jgi:hypothetical protein